MAIGIIALIVVPGLLLDCIFAGHPKPGHMSAYLLGAALTWRLRSMGTGRRARAPAKTGRKPRLIQLETGAPARPHRPAETSSIIGRSSSSARSGISATCALVGAKSLISRSANPAPTSAFSVVAMVR